MSIDSETTISGAFVLNGVALTFGYTFKILDDAELEFVMFNPSTGELTVADPGDYSVTGVGNPSGGNIVFSAAPGAVSPVWTGYARRKSEFLQPVGTDGPLLAATVVRMVDRAVMYALELREEAHRSIRFSIGETADALPPAEFRAGKVLAFDDDGLIDLSLEATDVAAVAAITEDIEAVSAITSAVTTLAGVSANITTLAGIAANVTALAAIAAAVSTCASNITAIQNAPTHATNAENSAIAAANSETNAATSESNAATSETNAAASAVAAEGFKDEAEAAKVAAEAAQAAAEDAEASIHQALNGVVFEWDTGTTDANPGTGAIRANNASLASATFLYVNETDGLGAAVSDIIATWDDSTSSTRAYITLRKREAPTNFVQFAISDAQTDAGVYRKFPVSYIGHAGSFSDGDVIGVIVERTGNKGDAGAGTGDMLTSNALSELSGVAATARGNIAAAPNSVTYIVQTANSELTNERALTDTATVSWDFATASQAKAGIVAGSIGATQLATDGVTTVKILNNNVTLAKIQQITTDRLLGRDTAGTGDVEQLTVGGGLEFTGSGGIQRSALTGGDVTASAGSAVLTIANDAVTYAKMQNVAGLSVVGRGANSSGDAGDITGTDGQVLRVSGTTLAFGTIATAGLTNDAVTFAKMQNIATDRLIGRDTASSGDPEEISVGGGLEFTGSGGIQRSALTGAVTASAGSNTTALASSILNAMAANSGVTGTITVSTSAPSGGADGDIWLERAA